MGMGSSEASALGMHLALDSSDEGWSDGDLRGSVQLGVFL